MQYGEEIWVTILTKDRIRPKLLRWQDMHVNTLNLLASKEIKQLGYEKIYHIGLYSFKRTLTKRKVKTI